MRLGWTQRQKQYIHERVGCAEAMNDGSFLMMPIFPLLAQESMKGKGGHTDMCRDRWKDRKASLWFIYTPVFTVS